MPRRMEVELTSARDDGTWTWRAAGAKQPKGVLDAALLPAGSSVGDVVKAEVEVSLDGVEVTAVNSGGRERSEPERLELLARRDDEPLVTTTLAPKGRGGRPRGRGREDRPGGRDGDRPRGPADRRGAPRSDHTERPGRGKRPSGPRPERERGGGREAREGREERRARPARSGPPAAPRAKRLRPARTHRKAFVEALPAEQQPVAEQVLLGGIPAVRQAIDKQNEQARTGGRPEVSGQELLALAERLAPRLRVAEWRDRAEAALSELDELDLRDLRSVVVASADNARDDEARQLATQLREGLNRRVETAQAEWLAEITAALDQGRVVRALRLSSRPPKAGAPFPADLAARLVEATEASLTLDATSERWAHVLDALSFSPVRLRVKPKEVPAEPDAELRVALPKLASRLPDLAARFGITAAPATAPKSRGGRPKGRPPLPPKPSAQAKPAPAAQTEAEPTAGRGASPAGRAEPEAMGEAPPEREAEQEAMGEAPPEREAEPEPGPEGRTQPAAESGHAAEPAAEAEVPAAQAAEAEVPAAQAAERESKTEADPGAEAHAGAAPAAASDAEGQPEADPSGS